MSRSPHHPFRARLDERAARDIRRQVHDGASPRALAEKYGVAMSSVYDVVAERTYPSRLSVRLDDATVDALTKLASTNRQSVGEFVAEHLRALAASVK
jgi:transposase